MFAQYSCMQASSCLSDNILPIVISGNYTRITQGRNSQQGVSYIRFLLYSFQYFYMGNTRHPNVKGRWSKNDKQLWSHSCIIIEKWFAIII